MYKKTILSIAIASTLTLTGCLENSKTEDENAGSVTNELTPEAIAEMAGTYPLFSPATSVLPFTPNDLLLQKDISSTTDIIEQSDGSFAIPGSSAPGATPPVIAYENLSGMSLTAPIDIEISGALETSAGNVNGTSFIMAGSAPAPNPNQNVFLLELDYASESALTALSRQEPPTLPLALTAAAAAGGDMSAGAALAGLAMAPDYSAEYITRTKSDGSTGHYIRVNPLKPLNPGKRYVVALTNEILDADGKPLKRSPGVAGYDTLSNEQQGLADPALAPVKALINNLWEKVTTNYFAVTNMSRTGSPDLGESNIVLSMSFTTTNDTEVVDYMVEPSRWITETVESVVRQAAASAAVSAGASDYDTVKAAVDTAYNGWLPSSFNAALAACDAAPAGAARFSCVGSNSVALLDGLTPNGLPTPEADTSITFTGQRDLRTVSAVISDSIATVGSVNISEGSMTIPYYSGAPDQRGVNDGTELRLVGEWWKADQDLATGISAAFGLSVPQADTTGTTKVQSDVVNALYPFPRRNSVEEIPVLAVYPASDANKPAGGYKTIIYQHGITTDRSVALTLGSAIVNASGGTVAVIAIDQPLHGVDKFSDTDKAGLAETLLAGAGLLSSADGTNDGMDDDAADQAAIDGIVAGTFAEAFVTSSLNGAGVIDATDGIDAGEQALIDSAFTSTLATTVVTGQLHNAGVIDVTDGTDASEQALIDSAFTATLASTVVTGQLHAAALIDMTDGLDAAEQALIDAVVAGTSGNPGLAVLEATAASLTSLEAAAANLVALESGSQGLVLVQNTVANGASQIPGLAGLEENERHFGFGGVNLVPVAMDFNDDTSFVGTSSTGTGAGSMTINVGNFLTSRDNFRQGILDMMTLRLSIPTMDIDGDTVPDLDTNNVHFVGHSLGTLNGIPFVEIANDTATTADDIVSATFLTPGGGIARFAENSPIFAPRILLGLASAAGISRGDANLEAFLNAMQASLDAFDPINFVGKFSSTTSTSKVLFTGVVGDTFIPNSAVPALDIVQPDELTLLTINGDYTVSKATITNPYAGISFGEGTDAPLAGMNPLQTISGAETINATGALGINFARFTDTSGMLHTSPVLPVAASEAASFGEIVGQITSIVATDGASVVINNPGILEAP